MPEENLNVTGTENVVPAGIDTSLSDTLDAALERVAPEPTPSAAPAPGSSRSGDAAAAGETGQPGAVGPDGRVRGPDGRFAPKDGGAVAPQTNGMAPPSVPGAQQATQTPLNEPPQSWKPEMRAQWDKLAPEVRGYVHQREQELQNGFNQIAQTKQVAEGVLAEFAPYAEQLQKEGASPISAMRTLLQTAHQLQTGGPEYRKAILLSLAQQYNVDLSNPVNMDMAKVEAQLATLSTEKLYGSAQNNQAAQQQTFNEFNAFANDPANEFFPEVRGIMASLIDRGIATNLKTAYDYAVGMHAGVRDKLISRAVEGDAQAKKSAAAANLSVRGGPSGRSGGQVSAPTGNSLRDTIENAFDSH